MATRYSGNNLKTTTTNNYSLKDIIETRGLNNITHYNVNKLKYPNIQQIQNLLITKHVWGQSDRYWKLAEQYYGDPKYWWVIAWFNKKPIESMINNGDYVSIPQPLSDVLGMV